MATKKEEKIISEVEIITLSKPLDIDGTKYTTIELRLGDLTGEDMEAAETQVRASGIEIESAHELCKAYLLAVASRAAKINIEYLRKLPIKDASAITLLVQGFLLA
ncbi:phage tail assembly protein [Klebsiella oxytoca]|uniref:phage tail assembly protein n=1 Tax=Klebsiella oxytoca TaxID=571 RepID=UPI0022479914|nr:phage tail assembly protein [Klebsiella oxytoca]EKW3298769.1 phage tail assembly protein [Klebsiella oxytoca]MCW9548012.1 phage tail assembly protein [Klebsiella oxytoca]